MKEHILLLGRKKFLPTSITNLLTWLDAKDINTITKDGSNLISNFSDKSGAGNHGNGSSTTKPTYVANDGDGLPSISSNNKTLQLSVTTNSVTAETIFMVVKVNAVSTTNMYLFGKNGESYGAWHTNATTPATLNWGTSASTTDGVGGIRDVYDVNIGSKYKILRFRRSQANNLIELYENGMFMGLETHTNGSTNVLLQIGGKGSLRSNINWREFIQYNGALTDAQCRQVERYLNKKWNVYSTPSWCANDHDAVKRYAIANNIASAAGMTKTAYFLRYIGDSTCRGLESKSNFNSNYIKLFTNAYIYNTSTFAWNALDTRNAASHNNYGETQSQAGMEGVLAYEIQAATGKDVYIMKYGVSGTELAVGWDVATAGAQWIAARRASHESIMKEVLSNGTRLIDLGLVIFLGTNDADTQAQADAAYTRYMALVNGWRSVPGNPSPMRVAMCEIFSSNPTYSYINTVRQAQIDAVAAAGNAQLIDGMDSAANTIDNTHPNAATYTAMGQAITSYLNA